MTFGTRADYAVEHFGGHYATQEELERCLKEIDESTAIVSAHNKRQIDFICSCCDDCCAMADLEHHGLPIRIPSRFRPSVKEDACVGCGLCAGTCPEVFHMGDDGLAHGSGIPEEVLRRLNSHQVIPGGHLGLNNVDRIVRLSYGEQYGLTARVTEQGSLVCLRLPIQRGEEYAEGTDR